MEKETRNMIVMIAIVAAVFIGGWIAISEISGSNPPFTVIESHSMQHCHTNDKHSEIGVIDTGDLIMVKNPNKCSITTYVEGSQNGYSSFGDYGDVIIYYRSNNNPVIHRAFLYLEYNGDGTWKAPALEGYANWTCTSGTNYNALSGNIEFTHVGNVIDGGKKLSIDLTTLANSYPHSGYLTVGDSVSNLYFDQSTGISPGLVSKEKIKSVAFAEIPWFGSLKLMVSGKTYELNTWAPNSKLMLFCSVITIVLSIIAIGYIIDQIHNIRNNKPNRE